MKNKIIFQLLLLAIGSTWLLSCTKPGPGGPTKKDPCPWPKITTEGKQTLGFKINGKEWVPCVDLYGLVATLRPINSRLTESDGSNGLGMSATYFMSSISDTSSMFFLGLKPLKVGILNAQDLAHLRIKFSLLYNEGLNGKSWSADKTGINTSIEILRLDTAQNIIAVKFSCLLISDDRSDTLVLTDGRFDITYYPQ